MVTANYNRIIMPCRMQYLSLTKKRKDFKEYLMNNSTHQQLDTKIIYYIIAQEEERKETRTTTK
jgi:Fe2+ or Zn2+ uptake regulation protein